MSMRMEREWELEDGVVGVVVDVGVSDLAEVVAVTRAGLVAPTAQAQRPCKQVGLDVLEDCAPSAELLLLVGHDFPDCEALLATRGAHLAEAETLYVGRWKVGVRTHWFQWEIGLGSRAPGQFGQAASIWRVLLA